MADELPLLSRIRNDIIQHQGHKGIRGVARMFSVWDENNDQVLSPDEFATGLQQTGVNLQPHELRQLVDWFDRDRSGDIRINEVIRGLGGGMTPARKEIVERAWNKVSPSGTPVDVEILRSSYEVTAHPYVVSGMMTEQQILAAFLDCFSDEDCDGGVNRSEFFQYHAAVSAGVDDDKEFNTIVAETWDLTLRQGNRRMAAEAAQSRGPPFATTVASARPKAPTPQKSGNETVDRLRAKLNARGGASGIRGLTRVLKIMDDDGNRKLSAAELGDGMMTYGLHPRGEELANLVELMDQDGSGQVSITEFVRVVGGSNMSQKRSDLVMQAYGLLDSTGDGRVTMKDVADLYDVSQHPEVLAGRMSPQEVLQDFVSGWDKDADGDITSSEFLDYYTDLSVGIDDDEYFELMIRNAWHLSGGVGNAANTSCRRVLVIHSDGSQTVEEIKNDLGIGPDDTKIMLQRLKAQGITDAKAVKLGL